VVVRPDRGADAVRPTQKRVYACAPGAAGRVLGPDDWIEGGWLPGAGEHALRMARAGPRLRRGRMAAASSEEIFSMSGRTASS